ncbi:MAG: heavy metal-associated domain-containing protein [candidate division Zixibacteria bacterium]|nr:heavy metal-associated domain-containing protein [candidate division Zixibacteria bacterium]
MSEDRIVLKVTGMKCDGCVMKVKNALKSVSGVKSAEIHLASKSAIVEFGDTRPATEQLIAAVKKAGFEATL